LKASVLRVGNYLSNQGRIVHHKFLNQKGKRRLPLLLSESPRKVGSTVKETKNVYVGNTPKGTLARMVDKRKLGDWVGNSQEGESGMEDIKGNDDKATFELEGMDEGQEIDSSSPGGAWEKVKTGISSGATTVEKGESGPYYSWF